MLEKKIKYTDFKGNEREETFYFNISKSELMKLNFDMNGTMDEFLRDLVAKKDAKGMGEWYRKFILLAYGEISDDGRRFVKDDGKLAEAFAETNAYDQLYMELLSTEDGALEFFKKVLPNSN